MAVAPPATIRNAPTPGRAVPAGVLVEPYEAGGALERVRRAPEAAAAAEPELRGREQAADAPGERAAHLVGSREMITSARRSSHSACGVSDPPRWRAFSLSMAKP